MGVKRDIDRLRFDVQSDPLVRSKNESTGLAELQNYPIPKSKLFFQNLRKNECWLLRKECRRGVARKFFPDYAIVVELD